MQETKYAPLEDRVLIRTIKKENEVSEAGIILDMVKKEVSEGEVVAAGRGRYAPETGTFIPTILGKGDLVLFGSEQGMPVMVEGEELRIMREGDVLLHIGTKEATA